MTKPTVFVIDDEEIVRSSLRTLLSSVQIDVETFPSADRFLARGDLDLPGCVITDMRMPGRSGLELMKELAHRGSLLPVIILTGHGEVPLAVEAIQGGAFDFIEKPFRSQHVLERVRQALVRNETAREERTRQADIRDRIARLTTRERQVMSQVVAGKPNHEIAGELGVSEKTIEFHRRNLMTKLGVESLAGLVRLGLTAEQHR